MEKEKNEQREKDRERDIRGKKKNRNPYTGGENIIKLKQRSII